MTGLRSATTLLLVLAIAGGLTLSACGGGDDGGEPATSPEPAAEEPAAAPEEPPTLNTRRVESELKQNLDGLELLGAPATLYPAEGGPPEETQIGGGRLDVRSVSCPEDVPQEKGETFSCEVDARKGGGDVQVTQLDGAGRKLRYRATLESRAAGLSVETKVNGKITLG